MSPFALPCFILSEEEEEVRRTNSFSVTDVGLLAIAEGCKKIHSLDLTGCHGITDKGVSAIAHNKFLRRLDLTV